MKVKLPDESSIYKWDIYLDGPEQSVYAVNIPAQLYVLI